MRQPQIFEGTREAILKALQNPDYAESRFRLLILPDAGEQETPSMNLAEALAPLLEKARNTTRETPAPPRSADDALLRQKLREKYQKMGFKP
jgi:hypothetical protein